VWESSPKTHIFKWKRGNQEMETNMIEYLKIVYNVRINYPD